MVTLRAMAAMDVCEGMRAGGGGPIQEALGRSVSRDEGQRRDEEASRRASIVSCWCWNVSLEIKLATGLVSLSVGVCGLEVREKGRGEGTSACSNTALMLRN